MLFQLRIKLTICQFLREMISKLTVASGNIKKEHLEDKWNLQFFFTGSTVMEMKEKRNFSCFFALFLQTFGWQMTIHSLFDPCDYQMGETSYVIKSTIVVLFLIFNL